MWQLRIAAKKSAVLHIGINNPALSYSLNDNSLDDVLEFRDLGVTVSNDLKFSSHCHTVSARAMQRLGIIFRSFCTRDHRILVKAFTTYVRPLLESFTVVWAPYLKKDIECLERVQHNFTWRVYRRCFIGELPLYRDRCERLSLDSLEF